MQKQLLDVETVFESIKRLVAKYGIGANEWFRYEKLNPFARQYFENEKILVGEKLNIELIRTM